jgi:hypothetical protein
VQKDQRVAHRLRGAAIELLRANALACNHARAARLRDLDRRVAASAVGDDHLVYARGERRVDRRADARFFVQRRDDRAHARHRSLASVFTPCVSALWVSPM